MMKDSNRDEIIGQRRVDHEQIKAFGELTEDRSALHFDPEVGRRAGYGGPIAHGLLTACWAVGALERYAGARIGAGHPRTYLSAFSLRLAKVVRADDLFGVRLASAAEGSGADEPGRITSFETLDQEGNRTSSGVLCYCTPGGTLEGSPDRLPEHSANRRPDRATVRSSDTAIGNPSDHDRPAPWALDPWHVETPDRIYGADAIFAEGPRGRCSERRLTKERACAFRTHVEERSAAQHDDAASESAIVPPMLSFALAFSDFLRDLMSVRMPADGFAGHIGDEWRSFEPIRVGESVHTVHRPLSITRSNSRPDMSIVRFGLQIVNQEGRVVQDGETVFLIPSLP
jgi:acyl dehydratase